MASRRQIFYRKEQPRSVSKTGLMLCLLLASGVLLVPIGGNVVHMGKAKLRDLALSSGVIDFKDCVVTAERTLACSSHAVGNPLPVVLRQIEDSNASAAAERDQRLKAEKKVRELTLDIERLNAQLRRAQLTANAGAFFPPANGDVRPTGLAVTNPSTGSMMSTSGTGQPGAGQDQPFSLTPPSEGEDGE